MRRPIVIALAAGVIVVVLMSLILIKPKLAEVSAMNKKVDTAKQGEQRLRLTLQQLEQARRDAPATQAKLAQFQALLPQTPDLPTFIRLVQTAANADGIDLTSIAPSPPQGFGGTTGANTGIQTVTVNLQVDGGFFRLESFLSRLEQLQRVVEVKNLAVTPKNDETTGQLTLSTTISLTMFIVQPGAKLPSASANAAAAVASPTSSASPGAGG